MLVPALLVFINLVPNIYLGKYSIVVNKVKFVSIAVRITINTTFFLGTLKLVKTRQGTEFIWDFIPNYWSLTRV